jgi:GT2 family glycosyltransferase
MEINLLSIIIPHYNKRDILIDTLRSINLFRGDYPIEIIVVDDGSRKDQLPDWLQINNMASAIVHTGGDNEKWRSPAIAYNTGFDYAQGDVIFLNGADCVHMGDMIGYVFANMKKDSYLNFSAYRGSEGHNAIFRSFDWCPSELVRLKKSFNTGLPNNWHIHSEFFPAMIPFCAAITKKSLEALNGFDERFAEGIGYEDSDFEVRLKNLGLDLRQIDEPYCLHQKHPLTQYPNNLNRELYERLQKDEPDRIKAIHNKIYVR